MTDDRLVVLGLCRPGVRWFADVARWASSGVLEIEFHKAISVVEARGQLDAGRAVSALLVDARLPGFDRDLVDAARDAGAATVVVDGGRSHRDIGAVATLAPDFGPDDLGAALDGARRVPTPTQVPGVIELPVRTPDAEPGSAIAVVGPGGTGTSTVAAALAQGLGAAADVLLADYALHADQALLHDVGDVIPGVPELVDAFRSGTPDPARLRALTYEITARTHHLLLGLRRHRDWTSLRARSLEAATRGLRRTFDAVVFDAEADLEGEAETGSLDVEDRNLLARTAVAVADVVVVVATGGLTGVHSLIRTIRDLEAAGVVADRIVPVLNRGPSRRRARVELHEAIVGLTSDDPARAVLSPVFLPDRAGVDLAFRDGTPLPAWIVRPVTDAVRARLDAVGPRPEASTPAPVPVAAGSLGIDPDLEGEATG